MNERFGNSNVYFLPAAVTPDEAESPEAGLRLARRLRHAWWRLRLALAEIRAILFRPRRRLSSADYAALLDSDPDFLVRSHSRPPRPARVIDFAAARERLSRADR